MTRKVNKEPGGGGLDGFMPIRGSNSNQMGWGKDQWRKMDATSERRQPHNGISLHNKRVATDNGEVLSSWLCAEETNKFASLAEHNARQDPHWRTNSMPGIPQWSSDGVSAQHLSIKSRTIKTKAQAGSTGISILLSSLSLLLPCHFLSISISPLGEDDNMSQPSAAIHDQQKCSEVTKTCQSSAQNVKTDDTSGRWALQTCCQRQLSIHCELSKLQGRLCLDLAQSFHSLTEFLTWGDRSRQQNCKQSCYVINLRAESFALMNAEGALI